MVDEHGLVVRPAPNPIPGGPSTVADVLDAGVAAHPDREALVGRHRRYSYAELDAEVDAASAALASVGVGPGDRVAASLPNQTDIVVLFLGSMRRGAVWVGVNPALATPEKRYVLDDTGASVFVTTPDAVDGSTVPTWTVDPGDGAGTWVELVEAHRGEAPKRPVIDPHAAAAIAYTSGTTGFPKGAVHSQHNLLWPGAAGREHDPAPPDERHGVVLPLTLLNLQVLGPVFAFCKATTCVCVDRVDPVGLAEWITSERITRLTAVPTMLQDLLTHSDVDPAALAVLRRPECGGSATPHWFRDLFRERFGHDVYTGYGLTEAPTAVTREMPGDELVPGGSGRALPPVELVIVGDDDRELPVGEVGEICVRARRVGPWAGVYTPFLGYWNRPEATRETLRGGILHTNDLGSLDAGGRLRVHGRRIDVIVRGGANVYPAEVERVLAEHRDVAAAAVFGVPDERLGEVVAAAVQLAPGGAVGEDDLRAHCLASLARYKVPRLWWFVPAMPRTAMGKIRKAELLAELTARG